jgi:hypothetical protein
MLDQRPERLRRIWVYEGTAAPTSFRLSTAAISCDALAAPYSVISNFTRLPQHQLAFAIIGRGMRRFAASYGELSLHIA